jgi:GNAT superfamily N-acetyltransferase
VPGSRLHVDLRIPGCRGVGERRVAEIVERSERPLDPGSRERWLEVPLRELARLDRPALRRVPEDEVVVAAVLGAPPLFLKDGERMRAELDDTARRSTLRRRELTAHERLAHLDLAVEQVDGTPSEADELATAERGAECGQDDRLGEQPPGLGLAQYLMSRWGARLGWCMAIAEVQAKGLEYLALATELLQRARLADEEAGLLEAADLQWWWRTPRRSDAIDQLFWIDDDGPVAGVVLTDWGSAWGCDLIVGPGVTTVPLSTLWGRAVEAIDALALEAVDVVVGNDDAELVGLLGSADFVVGEEEYGITWMDAEQRPDVTPLPEGFVLVDRTLETTRPHPMRRRNGEQVEARLRQCSLYDPALDLAAETADGQVGGYALFWFDPVTEVGMLEPMRVEDEYQRRGLASAMLTAGLDRLASRGAQRLKVGYATDAARSLYVGAGFRVTSTATSYGWKRRSVTG